MTETAQTNVPATDNSAAATEATTTAATEAATTTAIEPASDAKALDPTFVAQLQTVDAFFNNVRNLPPNSPERTLARARAITALQDLEAIKACAQCEWDETDAMAAGAAVVDAANLHHLANRVSAHGMDRVKEMFWRVPFSQGELTLFGSFAEESYNAAEDFAIKLQTYSTAHTEWERAASKYNEYVRNVVPVLHEFPEERRKVYADRVEAYKREMEGAHAVVKTALSAIQEAARENGYTPGDINTLMEEAISGGK